MLFPLAILVALTAIEGMEEETGEPRELTLWPSSRGPFRLQLDRSAWDETGDKGLLALLFLLLFSSKLVNSCGVLSSKYKHKPVDEEDNAMKCKWLYYLQMKILGIQMHVKILIFGYRPTYIKWPSQSLFEIISIKLAINVFSLVHYHELWATWWRLSAIKVTILVKSCMRVKLVRLYVNTDNAVMLAHNKKKEENWGRSKAAKDPLKQSINSNLIQRNKQKQRVPYFYFYKTHLNIL